MHSHEHAFICYKSFNFLWWTCIYKSISHALNDNIVFFVAHVSTLIYTCSCLGCNMMRSMIDVCWGYGTFNATLIVKCMLLCAYVYRIQVGMAIFPRPAWPASPRFTPCGFSPPCKGGGAGMGQDFRPTPRGGARMGLHFLDPPCPAPPRPILNPH